MCGFVFTMEKYDYIALTKSTRKHPYVVFIRALDSPERRVKTNLFVENELRSTGAKRGTGEHSEQNTSEQRKDLVRECPRTPKETWLDTARQRAPRASRASDFGYRETGKLPGLPLLDIYRVSNRCLKGNKLRLSRMTKNVTC
ncbi:hypothetical protein [Sigmofec virus UA08Rod_4138]|uniref:Uncharacterized protein n=1 Tax=Sigmofec virus UA08Rod_4138 TaxID=2929396 RepID=A0A976N134_9VIRU|nr:hypothetical protein [Sigmofec virus UA08Rod_4138]